MPDYKCTFILNSGRRGWTETYYVNKSTRSAAKTSMHTLGLVRMGLLAQSVSVEACRISDVLIAHDSDYLIFTAAENSARRTNLTTDLTGVAFLYRLQSGNQYWRHVYLRGLPDSYAAWTVAGIEDDADPKFLAGRLLWEAALIGEGVRIQAISKDAGDIAQVDVTDASVDGKDIIYLAAGHTFAAKDRVRVSRLKGDNSALANVTRSVLSVVAGVSFRFANVVPEGTVITIDEPGVARRQRIKYQLVDDSIPLRWVHHDTGRAFFVPRGRRRTTTR